jgi:hypothetical protein
VLDALEADELLGEVAQVRGSSPEGLDLEAEAVVEVSNVDRTRAR